MAPKKHTRAGDLKSFLHFICMSATPSQRKEVLKLATPDQINAICECALNILRQNVKLSEKNLNLLRRPSNKKLIYNLASKKLSVSQKKNKLVKQSGGFPFLALLAPIIGSVIGELISKR